PEPLFKPEKVLAGAGALAFLGAATTGAVLWLRQRAPDVGSTSPSPLLARLMPRRASSNQLGAPQPSSYCFASAMDFASSEPSASPSAWKMIHSAIASEPPFANAAAFARYSSRWRFHHTSGTPSPRGSRPPVMVANREQARAVTPLASAKGSRVSSSP